MKNFCTLFDINFMTQGLTMYKSLKRHCKDFHLYIFAFCDKSYSELSKMNLENATIISLEEFEKDNFRLQEAKNNRSRGEYCWTCASSTILYCLKNYNLESCTYLDADLMFFNDPTCLIEEMGDKSVLITEHHYTTKSDQTETSGKYCVQFMTFKNNEQGLQVLNWWVDRCIEWCYARFEDGKFGDQKYLDDWLERFDCVHSLNHLGGGVAPWNFEQYDFYKQNNQWFIKEISSNKTYPLIFYHFHDVKIQENGYFNDDRYFSYKSKNSILEPIYSEYLSILKSINPNVKGINPFSIKNIKSLRKNLIRIKFGKKGYLYIFGKKIFGSNND